jgi:hypothetical protein
MELYIKDRLFIPQLFPKQGSFTDFTVKREIIRKIAITAEDKEKYSIKEDAENNNITWDGTKDMANPLSVDFSPTEIDYLKRGCEALVDEQRTDDFWMTVEKVYGGLSQ